MGQDLREMFKMDRDNENFIPKQGHQERFLKKLEKELPQKTKSYFVLYKIAAAILVLLGLSWFTYNNFILKDAIKTSVVDTNNETGISFGDLSPDLKKVENYYVANINLELSKLEISKDNKALVDSFMERLSELNVAYTNLNVELNTIGPNDQTITALIQNLQLRLQLLQKLKKKLNELKTSKNEQIITNTI